MPQNKKLIVPPLQQFMPLFATSGNKFLAPLWINLAFLFFAECFNLVRPEDL